MAEDIKWLIGIGITFALALVAAFRSLSATIKTGDDALHARVNRVRDEYVRRVDHEMQVGQVRDSVKEMRDEMREGTRETNKRLDQVLAAVAHKEK